MFSRSLIACRANTRNVAGTISPGFMVTSKISMDEFLGKGIMKLLRDPDSTVKILVDLTSKDDGSSGRDGP